MALRSLDPALVEALVNGCELVALEAGRSKQGPEALIGLLDGTRLHACQTLALGDPTAQQALAATYAGVAGVADSDVTAALMQLIAAVEDILRQMDAAGQARGTVASHTPGDPGDRCRGGAVPLARG